MVKMDWPKRHIFWIKDQIIHYSIPFTWNLPEVRSDLRQRSIFWDKAIVGGPAVQLMPDFFNGMPWVKVENSANGIMQKINPMATKTSTGCIRKCRFCAVPNIEGNLIELKDWPDLPIITDNNLLACSKNHFNRVVDRLKKFKEVDFNQGVDARLLKHFHAERFAELKNPIIRLSLDSMDYVDDWEKAYKLLRKAGLNKKHIRSYALIGYDSGPEEAWYRCEWIASHGIKSLPMWFHRLDQLERNITTKDQKILGWTDYERKLIMQYYYQRGKRRALLLKNYDWRIGRKEFNIFKEAKQNGRKTNWSSGNRRS